MSVKWLRCIDLARLLIQSMLICVWLHLVVRTHGTVVHIVVIGLRSEMTMLAMLGICLRAIVEEGEMPRHLGLLSVYGLHCGEDC